MAFQSAQKSKLFYGRLSMGGYTRGVSVDFPTDMLDVTTIADAAKVFLPGQNTSTFSLDMLFDTDGSTTNTLWTRLTTNQGAATAVPLTYCPRGSIDSSGFGQECWMSAVRQMTLSPGAQVASAVAIGLECQTDGPTEFGVVVEDNTWTVDNPGNSPVNNGAATANGGVAHLHVYAYNQFDSDVITIEHSVDGVGSWATLATFSTVTSRGNERLEVAAGTTVRQYLRCTDDVTGTGTISRVVTFARR